MSESSFSSSPGGIDGFNEELSKPRRRILEAQRKDVEFETNRRDVEVNLPSHSNIQMILFLIYKVKHFFLYHLLSHNFISIIIYYYYSGRL
jgi:hypothetical protein